MDRLTALLAKNYDGEPWHGPSLKSVISGVDAKTASARPYDSVHTIWELVRHLTSWYSEVERRLKDSPAAEPVEGDWPDTADCSEVEWARAVAKLEDSHSRLIEAVKEFPADGWDKPVPDPRYPESAVTYFETVEGVLQHNAYHSGQITLLRRIITGR